MPTVGKQLFVFNEQIQFLLAKTKVPTRQWTDVWQGQHDASFMVAGAYKAELLASLQASVNKAITEHRNIDEFRKEFDRIVAANGWSYNGERNWRTRVIFETNLRTSYQAGRYAQLTDPAFLERYPLWRYNHSDAVLHPRVLHVKWNGLVLPANHPAWRRYYPPNGWGCKCTVYAESYESAARKGLTVAEGFPENGNVEATVGNKTVMVPAGIDAGWDYAPGASVAARTRELVAQKAQTIGGQIGDDLARDIARIPPAPPAPVPLHPSLEYFTGKNITVEMDAALPAAEADAYRALSGAPKGSTVIVARNAEDATLIDTRLADGNPLFSELATIHDPARNTLEIEGVFPREVPGQEVPRYVGSIAVAHIVRAATRMGIGEVTLVAGKSGPPIKMTGYIVWPELGFDAPLRDKVLRLLPPELASARTIADLYATDAGRAFWKAKGGTIKMYFNTAPGSQSQRTLEAYLRTRGLR